MQLKKIALKNFRGFESLEINFGRGMNLLTGINGSGKTSILEALSIALSGLFLGFNSLKTKSIGKNDIRLKTIEQNGIKTTEQQFPVEIEAYALWGAKEIYWKRYRDTAYGKTKNDASELQAISVNLDACVRKGEQAILPIVSYYGNGRLWLEPNKSENRKKKILSRFDGYSFGLDSRKSLAELEAWFRKQEQIYFKEKSEPILYSVVRSAILSALPGFEEIRYDAEINEIYVFRSDGSKLPYASLSDGQRGMLALIGDLAIRISKLNPHLMEKALQKTPGVVLIDEIDLYLHPKWQRNVIPALINIFPEIQFICTTHSPQVIGELNGEKIFSLDNMKPLINTFGRDSNTILEDLMNSSPRNVEIYKKFVHLENLISEEKFIKASELIEELSGLVEGSDALLDRLKIILNNLRAITLPD